MAAEQTQLISLVRHADAGQRERFTGDDSMRPLTRRGRRQAEAIAKRLEERVGEIVSSPLLRCVETLAPLSARARQAMTLAEALAEGQSAGSAISYLIEKLGDEAHLAACSHGDILEGVVRFCSFSDAVFKSEPILSKASTTELTVLSGKVIAVDFVAPPAS